MPIVFDTRIHGNAVVPERVDDGRLIQVQGRPWTDIVGLPWGWGKTFRGTHPSDGCWFHIPLPTVSFLSGTRLFLDSFFFFFNSDYTPDPLRRCEVTDVHLYDGSAKIWGFHFPEPLHGDWSNPRTVTDQYGITFGNGGQPRIHNGPEAGQRFHINTGLGISLHVDWWTDADITFHSAGASWADSATG